MVYKEVVDRINLAVNQHLMLADFGYGQLTDIKVLDADGDGANYPYAFLNPAGVARNGQMSTYSFNLIIMEMAITPDQVLKVQSDTIQYLNDIISELRFDSTFVGDVKLNSTIQVFRERFQDEVAGATAQLVIEVPDVIDNCEAPIATGLDVWVLANSPQTIGPDPGVDRVFAFATTEVDIYNEWSLNRWTTSRGGNYRFELVYDFEFVDEGIYPSEPVLSIIAGGSTTYVPALETNWPTDPQTGQTYTIRQTFYTTIADEIESLTFVRLQDEAGVDEKNLLVSSGANLKIYQDL